MPHYLISPNLKRIDFTSVTGRVLSFICGLLFIHFSFMAYAQNKKFRAEPYSINYTSQSGLPSDETYRVLCDRNNTIWIGSDNGVARFNGREFEVLTRNDGLTDNVVFNFFEDHRDRIWMSTSNRQLCYSDGDKIVPYKYNHLFNKVLTEASVIRGMVVDSLGSVHVGYTYGGFVEIDRDGKLNHFGQGKNEPVNTFNEAYEGAGFKRIENYVIPICYHHPRSGSLGVLKSIAEESGKQMFEYNTYFLDENNELEARFLDNVVGDLSSNTRISGICVNGSMYLNRQGAIYRYRNKQLELFVRYGGGGGIYLTSFNNRIWLGTRYEGLLSYGINGRGKGKVKDHFLDGVSVSSIEPDQDQGIWASSLEKGVYYIPNSKAKIIHGFEGNILNCITADDQGKMFLGFENGQLFSIDSAYSVKLLHTIKYGVTKIVLDGNDMHVYAPYGAFIKDYNSPNRQVNFDNAKLGMYTFGKDTDDDFVFVSSYGVIIRGDKHKRFSSRFTKVIDLKSELLLGATNGLFTLKDEDTVLTRIPTDELDGNINIQDICQVKDRYFMVTKSAKLGVMGENRIVREIPVPDMFHRFYFVREHERKLWIGTDKGVLVLSLDDFQPLYLLNESYGIPRGLVKGIDFTDEDVWMISTEGPCVIPKSSIWEIAHRVVEQELLINGATNVKTDYEHGESDFVFQLKVNSYRGLGYERYRFCLKGIDQDTIVLRENTINFNDLDPGEYELSASYSVDGLNFSEPQIYQFRIFSPWWWSWWFIMIVAMGAFLLIFIVGLFFIRRSSKKLEEKRQNLELRSRALRSQMNPHFTSNALNSIQNLILMDENELASSYLASFYKLLRASLNASSKSVLSVKDELEIVEKYLKLEKLRFKELIEFSISISPEIDQEESMIPSMILQPIVENAILHGIIPGKSNGFVEVNVDRKGEAGILVTIEDDGVGFEQASKADFEKDSMGLALIRERLQLMDARNELHLVSKTEGVKGTRVTLLIFPQFQSSF